MVWTHSTAWVRRRSSKTPEARVALSNSSTLAQSSSSPSPDRAEQVAAEASQPWVGPGYGTGLR